MVAALILLVAAEGRAQQVSPAVPARSGPQGAPVTQPERLETTEAQAPDERAGRRTRTTSRVSRRRSAVPAAGSLAPRTSLRSAGPGRQELSLSGHLHGGYDDNLVGGVGPGVGGLGAQAGGSMGSAEATLSYFQGNSIRSIGMSANGSLRTYPGYLDGPAAGGSAAINARTNLGRTMSLSGAARLGYEPLFSLFSQGAATQLLPSGVPDPTPVTGLYERRSLSSAASINLDHEWSRRDSTSLSYSFGSERFTDDDPGDNSSHSAAGSYRRRLARGIGARAGYSFATLKYTDTTALVAPTHEHRLEAGPEIQKALSRRTRLALSLSAGASYVTTRALDGDGPTTSWVPVGSGSLAVVGASGWLVEGGYRRDFSLLRGVTSDIYTTDTVFLATGGPIASRTELRLGGTYSRWNVSLVPSSADSMNVYGVSAEVGVALTSALSATMGYSFYHHRYSNPAALAPGFPADFDRHAVRAGLSVRVPLVVSLEQ